MSWIVNLLKPKGKKISKHKQVNSPMMYHSHSGGSWVTPDTAPEVSAFYSGIILIASSIAKLPFVVKNESNKILRNDPVTKILNLCPNELTTAMHFRLTMIVEMLTKGNAYAEIVRDSLGRPTGLYLIPSEYVYPQFVEIEKGGPKELMYRISVSEITQPSGDTWLAPSDVFHLRGMLSKDGIVGESIVHYMAHTLGINLGADKFANSLYANGGLPAGILTTEGSLSDDARKRLKEAWKANHGGKKVGGTAVLEQGLKFEAITFQPDVMQFLETRKFSVEEIARFLRIPPSKLGVTGTATYSNVEDENINFASDTLQVYARMFEQEADIKLLNNQRGGKRSDIDLRELFRGDMKTRADYYTKMLGASAFTPNRILELEGEEPYEGGDRRYVATNNFTPVDRVDEVLDAQLKSKMDNSEDKSEDDSELKEQEKELNRQAISLLKRAKN